MNSVYFKNVKNEDLAVSVIKNEGKDKVIIHWKSDEKKRDAHFETCPLQTIFEKVALEGDFMDGSLYASKTRGDAKFTVTTNIGTLNADVATEEPDLLSDQIDLFDNDDQRQRHLMGMIFDLQLPEDAKFIKEAEDAALNDMKNEYAGEKLAKADRAKFTEDDMRKIIAKDSVMQAELHEQTRIKFIERRKSKTPKLGVNFDEDGNKFKRTNKGQTVKERFAEFDRKVWAWNESVSKAADPKKFAAEKFALAAHLDSTKENWPEIMDILSPYFTYQPFEFKDVRGPIPRKPLKKKSSLGKTYNDPTDVPLKSTRKSLAKIKYHYNYYRKDDDYGLSKKPYKVIMVYRQTKAEKQEAQFENVEKAQAAMANSDDDDDDEMRVAHDAEEAPDVESPPPPPPPIEEPEEFQMPASMKKGKKAATVSARQALANSDDDNDDDYE